MDEEMMTEDAANAEVYALSELGQGLISAIVDRKSLAEIRMLIDSAPLWFQDDDGWSALHAAAKIEDETLVRLLLENGAVWNAGKHAVLK